MCGSLRRHTPSDIAEPVEPQESSDSISIYLCQLGARDAAMYRQSAEVGVGTRVSDEILLDSVVV